jgi:protein-S-isoprenylcysteine O-methyltransferase Ste14
VTSGPMDRRLATRVWLRGVLGFIPIIAIIFLCAGRLDYWQGWVYLATNAVLVLVNALALSRNPALVEERLKPGAGMKRWDMVYFALSTPLYLAALVVGSLDRGRFGWSSEPPLGLYLAAVAVYVLGQAVFLWAKLTNSFFSSVVRIQAERGQTVIRTGPYRFVRHPGYVGGILFGITTPLVLGSLWALLPSGIAAVLLIVRTGLEDHLLQRELPGYSEYTRSVKYRLLPGVW